MSRCTKRSLQCLLNCLYRYFVITDVPWPYFSLASYPAFTDRRKERLVSAVCACVKFSQKSGKPCYFGILPRMDYT